MTATGRASVVVCVSLLLACDPGASGSRSKNVSASEAAEQSEAAGKPRGGDEHTQPRTGASIEWLESNVRVLSGRDCRAVTYEFEAGAEDGCRVSVTETSSSGNSVAKTTNTIRRTDLDLGHVVPPELGKSALQYDKCPKPQLELKFRAEGERRIFTRESWGFTADGEKKEFGPEPVGWLEIAVPDTEAGEQLREKFVRAIEWCKSRDASHRR